jgi:pyridoxine 5-phosphate synthase
MTVLSVNVNKFATLRNSRGGNNPDVLKAALDCERFGAQGITAHPRPDERHIRRADVVAIAGQVGVEVNVEGFPSESFMDLVLGLKPAQATLVPDPPGALTSDDGWHLEDAGTLEFATACVRRLREAGVRTSLLVNPVPGDVERAARTGADRVELLTIRYAAEYTGDPERAVAPFVAAARAAAGAGLGVNAGHDLDLHNLRFFRDRVPGLLEVSIGHALVCDALYLGLRETIRRYRECLAD